MERLLVKDRPARMELSRPSAILLIHGLRVRSDPLDGWLGACARVMVKAGVVPLAFTYPQWVGWSAFAWPSGPIADGLTRRLAAECLALAARHGPLAVIAHSFGSTLIARVLVEVPRVELSGVVMFGSILPERFSWETMVSRAQIPAGRIRNELGLHASPVHWAAQLQRLGLPYGGSGVNGFREVAGAGPVDYVYRRSDTSLPSLTRHCREVWLPFLGVKGPRRRTHRTVKAATGAQIPVPGNVVSVVRKAASSTL